MQKIQRHRDTETERESQRYFFSLLVWQHSLAGKRGIHACAWVMTCLAIGLTLPLPRSPSLPYLHYIFPCNSSCISFCCGCDCACLLTLEMAGDNDNLIMHGASQSGPAQPSPVQPGPAPTPLGFRTWLNQGGGASSGFNGLAAIARWRFWWNFKCSLWPNEARVAADLTRLGLAWLGYAWISCIQNSIKMQIN